MTETGNKYRVYLDGGVGQDPSVSTSESSAPQPIEETPFCLGIVGNFSGHGRGFEGNAYPGVGERPLVRVTPDNVLQLAGLSPEIVVPDLPGQAEPLHLTFSSMDDFHPDSLFRRLDIFGPFQKARDLLESGTEGEKSAPGKPPTQEAEGTGGLLEAVLGETELEAPKPGSPMEEDLDAFIRRVVRPHVQEEGPDHSAKIAELDLQASSLMEAVMGSSPFREMEALWRSVIFLLSRVEVSSKLRVYLIDVSEEELTADLLSTDEPSEWRFAHTILNPVSEHGEALRWAALLGNLEFGAEPHQIPLLQRLGLLAEVEGIPWFSAADPALLGSRSIGENPDPRDWSEPQDPLWLQLRERPEATCINLSLPGFLLRAPYGFGTSKAKTFNFSQDAAFPRDLLWGNPCILWGVVLGRAFSRSGWNLRISGQESVQQLPTHPTPGGWEAPISAAFSQTGAARAREMGISPVVSPRGESQVTLLGYGSVSAIDPGLKAWWRNPL